MEHSSKALYELFRKQPIHKEESTRQQNKILPEHEKEFNILSKRVSGFYSMNVIQPGDRSNEMEQD